MQPDHALGPLFETINVTKVFGAFKALSNVSFRVSDGEFVSIVGPNGAGKTTLVNVVTGLLAPSGGALSFDGEPCKYKVSIWESANVAILRSQFGILGSPSRSQRSTRAGDSASSQPGCRVMSTGTPRARPSAR